MSTTCHLRIIHINDVYILDNLPSLATLIREKSEGPDHTIAVLAGDFVAPSLLSALDMGFGMVDTLLQTGIRYVCFGNHEDDVSIDSLHKRIREFKAKGGVWLNTNMPDFPAELPEYTILEVSAEAQKRRVALIGLLCGNPEIYLKGAFAGAVTSLRPVNDTAVEHRSKLKAEQTVDLVVPMTHQDIADDRLLAEMTSEDAKTPLFPAILGGHDHDVFIEQATNGAWIVKAGSDAHNTAIIDLIWENPEATNPKVTVELVETKKWDEDPSVKETVGRHWAVLSALDSSIIYRHPKQAPLLTSKGIRLGESTIAKLLCTAIRKSLSYNTPDHPVDCVLLQAGMIRGKKDYQNGCFTLSSLRLELPFEAEVIVLPMPGRVIAAAIKDTRADEGKEERSRYLQTCDNVVVAPRGEAILSINGRPFDPDETYTVATRYELLNGLNDIRDFVNYVNDELPGGIPPSDAGKPIKPLVLDHFMRQIWKRLPTFDEIDDNGDGVLNHDEIKEVYVQVFGWDADGDGIITDDERAAVEILVRSLIATLDMDDNGVIDRQEYERFSTV